MANYGPTDFSRWLRQRRAIRKFEAGSVDFDRSDLYDAEGRRLPFDPNQYRGCLSGILLLILIILLIMFIAKCGPFASDAISVGPIDSGTTASSTPGTTNGSATTPTGATEPTAGPTTTEGHHTFDDETLAGVLDLLGVDVDPDSPEVDEIRDGLRDVIDSISSQIPAYTGPEIDLTTGYVFSMVMSLDQVDAAFNNSAFECGDTNPVVACADETMPMPAGEVLIVAVRMDAAIPLASTERSYIYSLVFDSDGEPSNDWVFSPPFDWDFFIGTDRWYQATYSHTAGEWSLQVSQLTGQVIAGAQPSAVRAVITGNWVVWFVPTTELPVYPAPLRATSFAHDGAYTLSTRGGDVTGADPTEPLIVPPDGPVSVP